jgi:hypothetical protein
MARFYLIQIDSIYLTDDGTETGEACKLEVPNVEDLQVNVTGVSVPAIEGRVRQTVPWTAGKEFEIRIGTVMADIYADLRAFLNDANAADTSFTITGTGASGDFEVLAKPQLVKPFACAGFINTRIKSVVLRFETVSDS